MLEGFQERQALEMSHASHMHQHPSSLPSSSSRDGTQHLHRCHYFCWVFRITAPSKALQKAGLLLSPPAPAAPGPAAQEIGS